MLKQREKRGAADFFVRDFHRDRENDLENEKEKKVKRKGEEPPEDQRGDTQWGGEEKECHSIP